MVGPVSVDMLGKLFQQQELLRPRRQQQHPSNNSTTEAQYMKQQSEICMLSTKFRPRRQRNRSTKASFHCSTRGKELDVFFADSIDAQCVCYFVLIHLYRNIRPRIQPTVIRQLDAAAANASETETYAALAAAGRTESLLQTKLAYERPWRPFWHMARLWTRPGYEP